MFVANREIKVRLESTIPHFYLPELAFAYFALHRAGGTN